MLLSSGCNDHRSFPFTQLRHCFRERKGTKHEELDHAEELDDFALRKVSELHKFDEALEKIADKNALVDKEILTREELITIASIYLSGSPGSSLPMSDETRHDQGLLQTVVPDS